jgi:hypothetical protein
VNAFLVLLVAFVALSAQASPRVELERLLLHADSAEMFLAKAPRNLLENYTFVYESRSPFAASISADFPRLVFFTPDAKTVVTLTGQPGRAGADIIEALYFNDSTSSFETASYVLPKAIRDRGRGARKEVAACTQCHGTDVRPVFDSYPLWPGFYGSVKDSFLDGTELKKFQHFQSTTAKTGVYRYLIPPKGSRVAPYVEPEKLVDGAFEADPAQFKFMPNTRLGMALTELNRKRLFRKIHQSPKYAANEKSQLAALLECEPAVTSEANTGALKKSLLDENADRLERLHLKPESAIAQSLEMQETKFGPALGQIVNLSEALQVPMTDWSMSFTAPSYAFYDGILSGISEGRSYYLKEDFIFEMLKHLARTDLRYFNTFRVV